ncbi:MAG: hypothetical protein ACT4PY_03885 [Armatimonadota bacterium]
MSIGEAGEHVETVQINRPGARVSAGQLVATSNSDQASGSYGERVGARVRPGVSVHASVVKEQDLLWAVHSGSARISVAI